MQIDCLWVRFELCVNCLCVFILSTYCFIHFRHSKGVTTLNKTPQFLWNLLKIYCCSDNPCEQSLMNVTFYFQPKNFIRVKFVQNIIGELENLAFQFLVSSWNKSKGLDTLWCFKWKVFPTVFKSKMKMGLTKILLDASFGFIFTVMLTISSKYSRNE